MTSNPAIAKKRSLGLIACIALVVGNIVGSGVFLLPASLAALGPISIFGWLLTSAGALVLAIIFGRLARTVSKTGGPYTFSHQAFGDFTGFLIAWGYWISLWTGNAAIAVAAVGYLSFLFPFIGQTALTGLMTALILIWVLTWVNLRGVKEAGIVQIITAALKLIPLVLIGFMGLFWVQAENFMPLNQSDMGSIPAISTAAALTLWAYLGLESATVPADDVINPQKTIPMATLIGVLIAAVVYISVTFVSLGVIPSALLAESSAPLADVATVMMGGMGGFLVAIGAVISTIGTLNGFTLLTGQVPYGAAQDKLFPAVFGKTSKFGIPANAVIISSTLASILLMLNFADGLVAAFNFVILLAVMASLLPYALCSVAEVMIRLNGGEVLRGPELTKVIVLGIMGFVYATWALIGAGAETVMVGLILILMGVPIYIFMKWSQAKSKEDEANNIVTKGEIP